MGLSKGICMRFDESYTIDICNQVLRNDMGPKEAAFKLNKSSRQTLRIIERIKNKGLIGVKHGNFNRTPVNKIDEKIKLKVLLLDKVEYFDFNMF